MDFEFKDGDYLVFNKMSSWQKKYAEEHLPTYSETTFEDLRQGRGSAVVFFVEEQAFLSTRHTHCKRELSFNQIFGCDKEVVEVGEDILEHTDNSGKKYPLWVTFDVAQDELGSCHLTDGKDYKVIEVSHGGDCYLIEDDSEREQSYNKRFFDKYVLPDETCKLVYKYPEKIKEGCYGVIDKNKLSSWQRDFIANNAPWECDEGKDLIKDPTYTYFNIRGEYKVWFMYPEYSDNDIELSFNDIFFPRKENQ